MKGGDFLEKPRKHIDVIGDFDFHPAGHSEILFILAENEGRKLPPLEKVRRDPDGMETRNFVPGFGECHAPAFTAG
jgi:hypothetical protein